MRGVSLLSPPLQSMSVSPSSSNATMIAVCPFFAAMCNGVYPFLSVMSVYSNYSINIITDSFTSGASILQQQ